VWELEQNENDFKKSRRRSYEEQGCFESQARLTVLAAPTALAFAQKAHALLFQGDTTKRAKSWLANSASSARN